MRTNKTDVQKNFTKGNVRFYSQFLEIPTYTRLCLIHYRDFPVSAVFWSPANRTIGKTRTDLVLKSRFGTFGFLKSPFWLIFTIVI